MGLLNFPQVVLALLISSFCHFATSRVLATSEEPEYMPVIWVKVTVAKGDVANKIHSFVSQELRKFPDIEVTDTDYFIELSLLAISVKNKAGAHTGYSVSCAISSRQDYAFTLNSIQSALGAEQFNRIKEGAKDSLVLTGHLLQICGVDGLGELCGDVVTDLNAGHLEPARKMAAKLFSPVRAQSGAFTFLLVDPFLGIVQKPVARREIVRIVPAAPTGEPNNPKFKVGGLKVGDVLNVRSGPGMTFGSSFTVEDGVTGITLIGKPVMNGSTEWVQINVKGHTGWARSKYLKPSGR